MINETLVAAAQYMDRHGKAIGELWDKDHRVCMLGAIRLVVTKDGVYWGQPIGWSEAADKANSALTRLTKFIKARFPNLPTVASSIAHVNDIILKTKEETVKFMLEAAEWEPKE